MPNRTFLSGGVSYTLDVRPDRLDLRDRVYLPPTTALPPQYPLPSELRRYLPKYIRSNLVLDQGKEGACTGYGLAAVINYLLWTRHVAAGSLNQFEPVSPHALYDMARFYDEWPGQSYEGSSCRGAMKGWHKHGACSASLWKKSVYSVGRKSNGKGTNGSKKDALNARVGSPYRPKAQWAIDAASRPVGVYYRIDRRSVTDIQAAIKNVGAVYVSANVHSGWALGSKPLNGKALRHSDVPRIGFNPHTPPTGGHAFALVGYNEDGFIVQNSWGQKWGLSGFAVMRYDDWVSNGVDAWVCALGVPQTGPGVGGNVAIQGQQPSVARRAPNASLLAGDVSVDAKPTNPLVEPWSTEQAYLFSIVAGNNGAVDISRPDIASPADMVNSVLLTPVKAWLRGAGKTTKKVAIIAHGGLNSEADAIKRARVLGPYFFANGIYPIFYVWKTGIGETLKQELQDRFTPEQMEAVATGKLADARDLLIEAAAHGPLRWAWRQMKENAEGARRSGHALSLMGDAIGQLEAAEPNVQIHLVGHSAGSFVHGHLIKAMKTVAPASLTLFAPACPVPFALGAFDKSRKLPKNKVWLHILSDDRERGDNVVSEKIYGKSLLYLVARGFEEVRKTPLAGLERTIDMNANDPDDDLWDNSFWTDVTSWRSWVNALPPQADGRPACEVLKDGTVSTGRRSIPAAHGSFDNDIEVMTRTINRILGASPSAALGVPIEDLDY